MAGFGTRLLAELRGDRVVWAITLLLAVMSVWIVYSTSSVLTTINDGDSSYLLKHFTFVVGGLFLAYICYLLHYMQYSKAAPYMLILCIPLLVYTLAFGVEINDARRWIHVPFVNMTFQTSDFAKVALIAFVARAITSKQEEIDDFQEAFLPIIVPILIVCGLIAPADLSSATLLFSVCVLMMFVGRIKLKYIWLLMLSGIVLFAFLILLAQVFPEIIRLDTWVNRLDEFMHTDGGEQVQQSKIAMARGGFLGEGVGNSLQRNFLPSAYSDFIFAIIVEELGLIGGTVVIGLYLLLLFRCVRIVTRSSKGFGSMLVLGMGMLIVIQAMANIAVAVHLVPVTGLPMPFMSMGGTSILVSGIMIGMILSVSKFVEQNSINEVLEDD